MYLCKYVIFFTIVHKKEDNYKKLPDTSNERAKKILILLQELKMHWKDIEVTDLTKICDIQLKFPSLLKKEIQKATTSEDFIDLLSTKKYLTWLEIEALCRMAKNTKNFKASEAFIQFKSIAYEKKLSECDEYFLNTDYQYDSNHCVLMTAKLNLLSDNTSIKDLMMCIEKLEQIAKLPKDTYTLRSCEVDKGITITLIVHSDCYPHACSRTKDNYIELRQLHIRYIQFGSNEKIFANQLSCTKESLLELQKASSFLRNTCMLKQIIIIKYSST